MLCLLSKTRWQINLSIENPLNAKSECPQKGINVVGSW